MVREPFPDDVVAIDYREGLQSISPKRSDRSPRREANRSPRSERSVSAKSSGRIVAGRTDRPAADAATIRPSSGFYHVEPELTTEHMEPSTSHDRDGLSETVEPPALLLVEVPRFDERDTTACLDLLTAESPATERLLIVSVTETIGKTHRRWDDHVGEHPVSFAVVSASFAENAPGTGAPGADISGPESTAQANGEETHAGWLTTHHVDDPGDLTGLGVTISNQLAEWDEEDEQVVVCFRSLTTTLQYVSTEELVRFLGELRKHLEAAGAIAHFHVDPEAVGAQTLAAVRSVMDGAVVGEGDDADVELLE